MWHCIVWCFISTGAFRPGISAVVIITLVFSISLSNILSAASNHSGHFFGITTSPRTVQIHLQKLRTMLQPVPQVQPAHQKLSRWRSSCSLNGSKTGHASTNNHDARWWIYQQLLSVLRKVFEGCFQPQQQHGNPPYLRADYIKCLSSTQSSQKYTKVKAGRPRCDSWSTPWLKRAPSWLIKARFSSR